MSRILLVISMMTAVLALWPGVPRAGEAPEETLWQAVRSGSHVVIMRHALAPGTGDPANFDQEDCATQRNLSEAGRDQARRIGARFRANGIGQARILTSRWCRCRETAELLDLGPVTALPVLNSFFRTPERREVQTRALRAWIARQEPDVPVVLVTHQVNITALTGVFPASGEMVILRRTAAGELEVAGSIETG